MKQIRAFGALIGALALLAGVLTFATFVTPSFDAPAHAGILSVTAGSVAPSLLAHYASGTCGATITAGQIVTIDQSASPPNFKLADADASASSAVVAGMALNGCSAGQPLKIVTSDPNLNPGATLVVGTVYVLSATAGGMVAATGASATPTDFANPSFATFLGIGKTSTTMDFNPVSSGGLVP